MLRLPLLLAVLLAPVLAGAQEAPIRWGRISDAEIALDSVAGDPDASAVVLGDVGQADIYEVGGRYRYRLRRHLRVKVFKEAGYEMGEFHFRYRDGDRVGTVRGQTFVPEPDGSMRRVELGGRSVFEGEVADGVQGLRFSMPALAPGAVFEVEYTFETDNIVAPPAWAFQTSEPTVISEYRFTVPPALRYVVLRQGDRIEDRDPIRGVSVGGRTQILRWTASGLPALRDEPYMTTPEDYVTKLALQLTAVAQGDGVVDDVLNTWEGVAEALAVHPEFGRRLDSSRLRREVAASVAGTEEERARALYDLVRTGYVWNGKEQVFAERDLNDVIEARGGSSAELSLLLLALLREAGIPATPVLLSTRSNGRAIPQYPILNQFDHLLVLAEPEGGAPALLDPTDRHRPYGMVSVQALNGAAWRADPRDPAWMSVEAPASTSRMSLVQATLGPDGRLDGTVGVRLTGYEALAARTRLAEGPADAALEVAHVAEPAASGGAVVQGADDVSGPLMLEVPIGVPAGETVADEIYLTPFVVTHLQENPFDRLTREFPVDFAYPFERTYIAEISLPEGYTVESVPEPVRMTIPSRAVSYVRMVGAEEGRLTVRAVLTVSQAQVLPEEYGALRRLYDEVVAAESEAVVVTRVAPPAGGDAGEDGR